MIDDVSDIAAYYEKNPDGEHDRLDRHQLEHDLTWRFLDRYLPPRGSILEIGAATGRYTLPLAKQGYAVTAVDMSAGRSFPETPGFGCYHVTAVHLAHQNFGR